MTSTRTILPTCLLALLFCAQSQAVNVTGHAVFFVDGKDGKEIVRGTNRDAPFFPFQRGGVPCITYALQNTATTVPPELAKDLADARLIHFGRRAHRYWAASPKPFLKDAKVRAAVRAALKQGAVLFFDYHGIAPERGERTGLAALLKECGLALPGAIDTGTTQYYRARFEGRHPLLKSYKNATAGKQPRGYGWWRRLPDGYTVLARPDLDKTGVCLFAASNVCGKGTVVFNQVYSLLRSNTAFADNLVALAFGKQVAEHVKTGGTVSLPGQPAVAARRAAPAPPPVAKTFFPKRGPNLLYGASLERLPWTEQEATARIAFVAHEPAGIARRAAPVSLAVELAGTPANALKVRHPYGNTIPRQVRKLPGDRAEVFFHLPIGPYEDVGFFVYRGGKPESTPSLLRKARIEQHNDSDILLENDFLRVIVNKQGVLKYIAARDGSGLNNSAHWGSRFSPGYGHTFMRSWEFEWGAPRVEENGPTRVGFVTKLKPKQGDTELTLRYSLSAESPLLIETVSADKKFSFSRRHRWAPGGDMAHDTLVYAGKNGLRRMPMPADMSYKVYEAVYKNMHDDWYAFEDRQRGETCGGFFERENVPSLNFAAHGTGLWSEETIAVRPGNDSVRAIFAMVGDHARVYPEYLAWKNPPSLHARSWQQRSAQLLKRTRPQLGREPMSWMWYFDNWFRRTVAGEDHRAAVDALVEDVKYQGGNGVALCMHSPELIRSSRGFTGKRLADRAHADGLVVMAAPFSAKSKDLGLPGPKRVLCYANDRAAYHKFFRELAETGIDYVSIGDEARPHYSKEAFAAGYKQIYGEAPPETLGNLEHCDTPQKGKAVHVRNVLMTEWAHDMTRVIKEFNPAATVTITTSPNNHNRIDGFQDIERFMARMDVGCTDLYTQYASGGMKYMTAYMRGARGNGIESSPLLIACCNHDPRNNWNNLNANLLLGNVNLIYYGYGYGRKDRQNLDVSRRFFYWRTLSGLGRAMMQASQRSLFAVCFDHDAFTDCILRGEFVSPGMGSMRYNRAIARLYELKGFRPDMVMKRYCSPEQLARYQVLIVPGGHVANPRIADAIRTYAENGGKLIVVGDALRVPAYAAMTKLSVGAASRKRVDVRGRAGRLRGYEATLSGELYALKDRPADASVLAESGDGPLVLSGKLGKGTVAACLMATDYAELVAKTAEHLAGGPAIVWAADGSDDIERTLFRGEQHVACLFNPRSGKPRRVAFRLKPEIRAKRFVVDMKTGNEQQAAGGVYSVTLEPMQAGFFLLTDTPPDNRMTEVRHVAGQPDEVGAVPRTLVAPSAAGAAAPTALVKEPGRIYVGILHSTEQGGGSGRQLVKGSAFMRDVLGTRHGLVVNLLSNLRKQTIADYDVIIVPNFGHPRVPKELNEDWQTVVRDYVGAGGGLLLCHHACGYGTTFGGPVFPQIGTVNTYVPLKNMQILADHDIVSGQAMRDLYPKRAQDPAFADQFNDTIMKKGDLFVASYPDYMAIKGAKGTVTIAGSQPEGAIGGDDVVVAGRHGKGKAILCGLSLGCRIEGKSRRDRKEVDHLSSGERKLLINMTYWLAK